MASQFSTLTDSELDNAWAAYAGAGSAYAQYAQQIASEIASRLASPVGFIDNLLGTVRFPKYNASLNAAGQSLQGAAASSLGQSLGNIGSTITNTVQGLANPVIIVAGLVVLGIFLVKKGK